MDTPGSPGLPPADLVLAWIENFLKDLPGQTRQSLGAATAYLGQVMGAIERACKNGDPSLKKSAEGFVEKQMEAIVFRERLDPTLPLTALDDPYVLEQAVEIAGQILRGWDRALRPLYGDLIDVAAAKSIGWFGLVELSRKMWGNEEIENPQGLLRTIVKRDVSQMVDGVMRRSHPGARAKYELIKKLEKQLRETQPELEDLERRALAAKLAHAKLQRAGGLLDRVAAEGIETIEGTDPRLFQLVFDAWLVEEIDKLVADMENFTDTDRDAWARFKAAGLRGKDIDWSDLANPAAGYQRLHSLLAKIRDLLADWRC